MSEKQKILVLTDFSIHANAAVCYALELAPCINAGIYLLYVADINDADSGESIAELEFAKLVRSLPEFTLAKTEIETHIRRTGNMSGLVNKIAKEINAPYIVMGMIGVSGIDKIFGSVTTEIIAESKVPVLAVPQNAIFNLNEIVFASDYRETEERISVLLPPAKVFNARLHVLHIQEPGKNHELTAQEKSAITGKLKYPKILFASFADYDIADGILEYLEERETGLVVLFPGDRSWFEKVMGRSVTRNLALRSGTPLLTFPVR